MKKTIVEAFEFIRNGVSVKQNSDSYGVPITRIETIADKTIDSNRVGYANIDINNLGKFKKYLLKNGDILMSHINSPKHLGKTAVYQQKPSNLIHGMNLLCLRPNNLICNSAYANYYFQSTYFSQDVMIISNQSVNQASFSVGRLKKLKIPFPPLKTQEHIAGILDDAAALRDKTKQLLEEYDNLAQSLFLDMFGDPITNPKKLKVKALGDLGVWQSGGTPSRKTMSYYNGDTPWLSSGELNQIYTSDSKEHITARALKESSAKLVPKGSLLLGMYDTAALKSTINTRELSCNQAIAFGVLKEDKVNIVYAYYILQIGREHYRRLQRGARQKNLNLSMVREIKILLPDLDKQNEFAEKIALIEQQKDLARQELKESEDLFNCLLQKAFKGELVPASQEA